MNKKYKVNLLTKLLICLNFIFLSLSCFSEDRYYSEKIPRAAREDEQNLGNSAISGCNNCNGFFKPVIPPTCICNVKIPCAGTPITAPVTISSPGYYCLANDITGGIIITANDVSLDLNNHTMSGAGIGSGSGIVINSGFNRKVFNGRIVNFDNGVSCNQSMNTLINEVAINTCFVEGMTITTCTGTVLDSIVINTIGNIGVHFNGINDASLIKNVTVSNAQQGIICDNISNSIIEFCNIFDCTSNIFPSFANAGFAINGGSSNQIDSCTVKNLRSIDFPVGFVFDGNDNIVVRNCVAQNITAFSPTAAFAAGYLCTQGVVANYQFSNCSAVAISGGGFVAGFEMNGNVGVIEDCIAQDCIATAVPPANGVGFFESGRRISLTNCQAFNCSGAGFSTNSGTPVSDVTFQYCQSTNSTIGFLTTISTSLIGNCVAFNNTTGFQIAAGTSIYHCFASNNGTHYAGAGAVNVQNANTQVDTTVVGPTGPFAGANLFM
ncbi:right-handed parallel beta-helix repeat-containing protein [Candidatus Dependentiae bacterium]|nr:right-handed parallel beta-helix repeat-containing protein [Candidatus Dependentiae bacterium]